ncbi:MAG: preprotein translocase subunit SecY [Nanoarchaeota archaeon]|nr:preprotein translocase subunit SecY [Nanoarchaeota archaeon]
MGLNELLAYLPEVKGPIEKKLGFNVKLKWTLIILASYFVLANTPLYGLAVNALSRFEYLSVIMASEFGSVISLGIGPIVMASIVLQLLVGAKILDIDLTQVEGKKLFQGLQKLLVIFFCIFEAAIFVMMGGLQAMPGLAWILILQIFMGGILIMFMDEVTSKWGFGSGVSMFIAAGVGWHLFTQAFGFLGLENQITWSGKVWSFFISLGSGDTINAAAAGAAIIATIIIFLIVVWAQSLKVEVPLSFGKIRGFGLRWPLSFFYTSVIPVILIAALLANVQLFATLLQNWLGHATFLGGFSNGVASSGLVLWLSGQNLVDHMIRGSFSWTMIFHALVYVLVMVGGAAMFAVFWVKTSGQDSANIAKQILSSGMQIPGFRNDPRILETILDRYIMPLTVMGGAAVGILAASADLLGALVRGTGLLLAVMIVYKMYNDIAQQHAYDMHPSLRKVMGAK